MAWTSVGGKLLYVETSRSPGKGKIEITGQLGEVMKESVYTGLGWIKSHTALLAIDPKLFENCDINIHFPAAASPKDGPSAGITIVTALVSLFTERKVRSDISMTGEISLKGVVLGVGGVREKVLAAYGGGIKGVILPEKNRKDVEEVGKEIREKMSFYFVKDVESVLEIALEKNVYNPVQEHDGIPFNKLSKL
jgi:ATP-dependent Lon protease